MVSVDPVRQSDEPERSLRGATILEPSVHPGPGSFASSDLPTEINGGDSFPSRNVPLRRRWYSPSNRRPTLLQLRDVWSRLCSSKQPTRVDALEWVSCATLDIMGLAGECSGPKPPDRSLTDR